jgi:hypothetical protein
MPHFLLKNGSLPSKKKKKIHNLRFVFFKYLIEFDNINLSKSDEELLKEMHSFAYAITTSRKKGFLLNRQRISNAMLLNYKLIPMLDKKYLKNGENLSPALEFYLYEVSQICHDLILKFKDEMDEELNNKYLTLVMPKP